MPAVEHTTAQAGRHHGQHTGNALLICGEVGGVGDEQREDGVDADAFGRARNQAAAQDIGEHGHGSAHAQTPYGDCDQRHRSLTQGELGRDRRCHGHLERHERHRIVEQALAAQEDLQAVWQGHAAHDAADRYGIGGRQGRCQGHGHGQRHLRQQSVQPVANHHRGQGDQADGQAEHRPDGAPELALGHLPGLNVEQWGHQDCEQQWGLFVQIFQFGEIRQYGAGSDLQGDHGQGQLAPECLEDHHGAQHDESEFNVVHGWGLCECPWAPGRCAGGLRRPGGGRKRCRPVGMGLR